MNGQKSSSISRCFLVFYVLMALGCAVRPPNLKMPENLPPIIKEYKHISLYTTSGDEYTNYMASTGIYLKKSQPFSILATGKIQASAHAGLSRVTPKDGFPLIARIEKNHYFQPFFTEHYGVNGITLIAPDTGILYLGINLGWPLFASGEAASGPYYLGTTGHFSVDIVVWKTQEPPQIIGFLKKMKDEASKSGANSESVDAITDAMDAAGYLPKKY